MTSPCLCEIQDDWGGVLGWPKEPVEAGVQPSCAQTPPGGVH